MQPPRGSPDQLGEARFHVHVDVFELAPEGEPAGAQLLADTPQPVGDRRAILGGNDALLHQHGAVGQGPSDVLFVEAPVDIDCNDAGGHYVRRTSFKWVPPPVICGAVVRTHCTALRTSHKTSDTHTIWV